MVVGENARESRSYISLFNLNDVEYVNNSDFYLISIYKI